MNVLGYGLHSGKHDGVHVGRYTLYNGDPEPFLWSFGWLRCSLTFCEHQRVRLGNVFDLCVHTFIIFSYPSGQCDKLLVRLLRK